MLNVKKLLTKILTGFVKKTGDTMTGILNSEADSSDIGFFAKRTDTNVRVMFGVGSTGTRHGVYSYPQQKWLIHGEGSEIYIGGQKFSDINKATTISGALSGAASSLANNAWASIGSIEFPAGLFLVIVQVQFGTNANGRRQIGISSNNAADSSGVINNMAWDFKAAVNGASTFCSVTTVINFSATTRYYVKAYQNSGSALAITPRFTAVKLK